MRCAILISIGIMLVVGTMVFFVGAWPRGKGSACRHTINTSEHLDENRLPIQENTQACVVWSQKTLALDTISIGMHQSEVLRLLGRPTLQKPLYEPDPFFGKHIGTTLFYLREPDIGIGGDGEEIRIYLDLHGRVRKIWDDVDGEEHLRGQLPRLK